MEYDTQTVGRERRIVLAHGWVWKFDQATAVGIHDRYIGAFVGSIVLKNDQASIRRPVCANGIAAKERELAQIVSVRTHCEDLQASTRQGLKRNKAIPAREGGVGGSYCRQNHGATRQYRQEVSALFAQRHLPILNETHRWVRGHIA